MEEAIETNWDKLYAALDGYWDAFIAAIPRIGLAILIIVLGFLIAGVIGRFTRSRMEIRTEDPLMSTFVGNTIKTILVVTAIMLALQTAGLSGIAGGILATAGASAVVLGFAFKDIGENFIAGIILAFNRPFNVNDTIRVGDVLGKVKSLQFRYTHIKTFNGQDVYIPNSDVLTDPVTNYTEDGFFRWDFVVGIAYEDDINGAKEIIQHILDTHEHVVHDDVHENFVAEDELAASTVNIRVYFWVETLDFRRAALITKGEVIRNVKVALEQNGYSLPADIREIKLYGKEKNIPVFLQQQDDLKP
ncbi:mechanosensitive ion channel family protein [Telluribacter sp. SYSU D00476]|uniref:mechanosensitive ion channel family protein n=1 Tax=Telluribacter sp. SYSU D00476 TaxID=2811430 RepID=UPI001FF6D99F|nr:mechanosensitive ion channel [Telluribacter sp. SYSU D00476]